VTKPAKHLEDLEARLGHRFADRSLMVQALTHASAGQGRDNQRLEFLGDALLNFAVALLLHRERPDWEEGPMSKFRGVLVRTDSLHAWAVDLGLEGALRSAHPKKAPPMGPKPLADALEALLAALYLDVQATGRDGASAVLAVVAARFLEPIRTARADAWARLDPKTSLQERAAQLGLPAPVYSPLGQSGPGHAPRFTVRATVGARGAEATGSTRKRAEEDAARQLLDLIDTPPPV
jgi:ribonuclease-3